MINELKPTTGITRKLDAGQSRLLGNATGDRMVVEWQVAESLGVTSNARDGTKAGKLQDARIVSWQCEIKVAGKPKTLSESRLPRILPVGLNRVLVMSAGAEKLQIRLETTAIAAEATA